MRMSKIKKLLNVFLGVLGLFLMAYAVWPKGISYNNVGIWAIFLLGFAIALNFLFLYRVKKKWAEISRRILSGLLLVALIIIAAGAAIIYSTPEPLPLNEDCTLIVLGARTFGDKPGGVLKTRLDTAAEFLKENPEVSCIVTGGKGADETHSEASVSKKYLIEKGIDEKRIITEEASTSTGENLSYSLLLAKTYSVSENFLICTDPYHQYRSSLFCDELGINSYALSTSINLKIEPIYLVREILAVFYYFVI